MELAADALVDPKYKVLPFKVRACSKEAQPHKAAHVLDTDLRSHWSTSTNSKEWLLLELEEACLLHQIRIQNKSVLEWEISAGLRYKPETFLKIRARCEAPRREFQCMTNHVPCKFVKISCLRGNPIAIYSVQLIGISMPGLEPEFQPLVEHVISNISSHKQDVQELYLQLLRNVMTRLSPFLPQLEAELAVNGDGMEHTLRFLAMLSGPFYPVLAVVDEREKMKVLPQFTEFDICKGSQASFFTVSSNFQAPPKRSRSPICSQHAGHLLAFRPDLVFLLLKLAYKDSALGVVCRMVSRLLYKLNTPTPSTGPTAEMVLPNDDPYVNTDITSAAFHQADYSLLFGEDFVLLDDTLGESGDFILFDIAVVEEGLFHFLYACVSQPVLCWRLMDMKPDLLPVLPFIQAIVPALRPACDADQIDDTFIPWRATLIQHAVSQVVSLSTSPSYRPLLEAYAGLLLSFSPIHEKIACVIIDLCAGPLAPWLPMVIAKVDLTSELIEGVLSIIQMPERGISSARAALMFVMIGLSGHLDDVLSLYKAAKHNLIFLIEILEPLLLPTISPVKSTIAFGDVSTVVSETEGNLCTLALDFLRVACTKSSILPALESEWREGKVKSSVLLSVLASHLPLPSGIDLENHTADSLGGSVHSSVKQLGGDSMCKTVPRAVVINEHETIVKTEWQPNDAFEDASHCFVPAEMKSIKWKKPANTSLETQQFVQFDMKGESKSGEGKMLGISEDVLPNAGEVPLFFDLQADYNHLLTHQERELRALEFIRFAMELHSQVANPDGQYAAIDTLLLAAECHLNPFFALPSSEYRNILDRIISKRGSMHTWKSLVKDEFDAFRLEEDRDKAVLRILLKAAEWDREIDSTPYEQDFEPEDAISSSGDFLCSEVNGNDKLDAITFVRKYANVLCRFLVHQLEKDQGQCEACLQGLVFLLYSATRLSCRPEEVVDIILNTVQNVNVSLIHYHVQSKEGSFSPTAYIVHRFQRQWTLIGKLLSVATGCGYLNDDDEGFVSSTVVLNKDLMPVSVWIARLAEFSSSQFPLVRFIGWKGLACFAKAQEWLGIVLASDLQHLSSMLSVFLDPMISLDLGSLLKGTRSQIDGVHSHVSLLYPELEILSPNIIKQMGQIAEALLDAVCFQLKNISPSLMPDVLCWLQELCLNPFGHVVQPKPGSPGKEIKSLIAANFKIVFLRLFEIILVEHLEAIVPELPRVIDVLLSLCRSAYCDVSVLDSALKAFKPIVSYGLGHALASEFQMQDDSSTLTFETLCFDTLLDKLRIGFDGICGNSAVASQGALLLFLSGYVLSDLSTTKRSELLSIITSWADFASYSPTTAYHDYLCAFERILEACKYVKEKYSDEKPFLFVEGPELSDSDGKCQEAITDSELHDDKIAAENLDIRRFQSLANEFGESHDMSSSGLVSPSFTTQNEQEDFAKYLKDLVSGLGVSLEKVWELHPNFAEKVMSLASHCLLCTWSRHVSPGTRLGKGGGVNEPLSNQLDILGSDVIMQVVAAYQKAGCWRVAACMMEGFLLTPARCVEILEPLSLILHVQCLQAPRLSWRLLTTKWLFTLILKIAPYDVPFPSSPLANVTETLLGHKEPEQRAGILEHIGKLLEGEGTLKIMLEEAHNGNDVRSFMKHDGEDVIKLDFVSDIIATSWDRVCSLAACDYSLYIRRQATELLMKMIPFAQPHHLSRLLSSVDSVLPGLAKFTYTMMDASITRISLTLLSRACLYASTTDINVIPSRVWSSLEILSKSKSGNILANSERAMCNALLQLREHGDSIKQSVENVLSQQVVNHQSWSPEFAGLRETVLKVLARLQASRQMEDDLANTALAEAKELEEAELELEVLKGAKLLPERGALQIEASKSMQARLKEIRTQIHAQERVELQSDIIARHERQRIARRNRQQALEEATLKEVELLQELDREKAAESEREIERLRNLERERARTRELRYNLDIEVEKRAQRDIQKEIELREPGMIRLSRGREFSGTSSSSRPRERYREREGGRSGQESRSSSTGMARESSTTPPTTPTAGASSSGLPSIVIASSGAGRPYPIQASLGLSETRDRMEDRAYDDALDAISLHSEAVNYGDVDAGLLDLGRNGGQRQGTRGSRPRQIIEKRERESRREGKWERKN